MIMQKTETLKKTAEKRRFDRINNEDTEEWEVHNVNDWIQERKHELNNRVTIINRNTIIRRYETI